MIEWRVRRTASQYKLGRPHLCVIAAAQALRPRLHGVASRIRGLLLAARQPCNWAGALPIPSLLPEDAVIRRPKCRRACA